MARKELPKLPYGQGTFFYHNNSIGYRKRIKFKDGSFKTKTVYGKTTKECMGKMREHEKILEKEQFNNCHKTLIDAMNEWFDTVKQPTLKKQSATRLQSTIRNQIEKSDIGHFQYSKISSKFVSNILFNHVVYVSSSNSLFIWTSLK